MFSGQEDVGRSLAAPSCYDGSETVLAGLDRHIKTVEEALAKMKNLRERLAAGRPIGELTRDEMSLLRNL